MVESSEKKIYRIAVLGGTGKEGKGLALRWAKAGHQVWIGSREKEKAEAAAAELNALAEFAYAITGTTNQKAANLAEIAVLTVPFSAQKLVLNQVREELKHKILVDVTVPLQPPRVTRVFIPPAGSAAMEAKGIVDESTSVVSAFQNVSFEKLLGEGVIECEVLVSGDRRESREIVCRLAEQAGMTAWDAGLLENSVVAESLTSILIGLNRQHKKQSAGIKIIGLVDDD